MDASTFHKISKAYYEVSKLSVKLVAMNITNITHLFNVQHLSHQKCNILKNKNKY